MKTFLPFLLTIVVVTAAAVAASRSDNHKLKDGEIGKNMPDMQHFKRTSHHHTQEQKKRQLNCIMEGINVTKKKLSKQILDKWVPDVLQKSCTPEELCKAGKVLATFKAKDLGLEKEEWILHRQLLAYTKGIGCSATQTTFVESALSGLLQEIYECALRELSSIYYNLNSSTSYNPEAHLLHFSTSYNPEARLLNSSTSYNPEARLLNSSTSYNPEARLLNSSTSYNPEARLLNSSTSYNPEAHLLNFSTSYNSKLNSYTLSSPTTQSQHFCLHTDNIK